MTSETPHPAPTIRREPVSLATELAATWRLALPVMGARAGMLTMVTVDTIMCGRLGGAPLAFYAIATAPFVIAMLVGLGLLSGTIVLVAQAHGAGDGTRCGLIWRASLVNAVLIGTVALLLLWRAEPLLASLGQAPEVARGGAPVIQALALGMPGLMIFNATVMLLEGLGRPRPGMLVMLGANLVNLALNLLLMHGPWALGATGAALATTLTRWGMAAAIVGYALLMRDHARLGTRGGWRGTAALQGRLWRLGLPLAAAQGLETSAFQGLTVMSGWLGTVALAAHQAAVNLNALVYMLTLGVATAASVRVGHAVGRADPSAMRRAGWTALVLLVVVMAAVGPLVALGRAPLAAIYTADPTVQTVIAGLLLAVAVTILPDGGQGVMTAALRGAADVWLPTLLHLLAWWAISVPVAYVCAFSLGMGVIGLWVGILSGAALAWLLLSWRFSVVSRRGVRQLAR
jgi:MATE family multidrug resistance protein